MIGRLNTKAQQTWWLTMLVSAGFLWSANAGDTTSADETQAIHAAAIRIVHQNGRQPPSGKRNIGSEIFDVTVGPVENEFIFFPDTVYIAVGDTVRWTWAADFHSVTSGRF